MNRNARMMSLLQQEWWNGYFSVKSTKIIIFDTYLYKGKIKKNIKVTTQHFKIFISLLQHTQIQELLV